MHITHIRSPTLGKHRGKYLIIVLVHTSVISLQDELFLKVNVALILNVLRKPLLWAVGQIKKRRVQQRQHQKTTFSSQQDPYGVPLYHASI